MGMPLKLLPQMFEPFVQGERALHGSVGGLGIGLYLVRNVVEFTGVSLIAHSAGSGLGSTLIVRPFGYAA
jgi:signal transduction histidine kinase